MGTSWCAKCRKMAPQPQRRDGSPNSKTAAPAARPQWFANYTTGSSNDAESVPSVTERRTQPDPGAGRTTASASPK